MKTGRPPARRRSARPARAMSPNESARGFGANTYLYGITRAAPGNVRSLGAGVGDPPGQVRLVRHGKIAAAVSDVRAAAMDAQGTRGLRRDMKAHSAVLHRLAESHTVLPVRFGFVVDNDQALVATLLEPQQGRLLEHLDALEGMVEISLKATYVEPEMLREVLAARPELAGGAGGRRSGSMACAGKIELGRRIAEAIADFRDADARWLLDALAPVVGDVRVGAPLSQLMVLNAAFLVRRDTLEQFDRRLEQVNEAVGRRMTFDCVGPLPPYSFVNLTL